ncbi:MAG TPA: hypothetical protein VFU49_19525 [Ktedonobacteraceae bacterium]|nr:hypothetical protein [Ktedonobacteraceae bacterium]
MELRASSEHLEQTINHTWLRGTGDLVNQLYQLLLISGSCRQGCFFEELCKHF